MSHSSGEVLVAPRRHRPCTDRVRLRRGVRAVEAQLGAVEERIVVAVRDRATSIKPSRSTSSDGFGSAPSRTPSSSESASFGSEPSELLEPIAQAVVVRVDVRSRRRGRDPTSGPSRPHRLDRSG